MLLFIPGITGVHETDEYTVILNENEKYDKLLAGKKGSDDYELRGSQTQNHTIKSREIHCTELHTFVEHPVPIKASPWSIDDAAKEEKKTELEKMNEGFYSGIQHTMDEKIKDPRCLIDAEALASHVSVVSMSGTASGKEGETGKRNKGKKGATSSRRSGSKMEQSSATGLKESNSESQTSKMSNTSTSITGTGAVGSSTEAWPSQKAVYADIELPDTIKRAIIIIERLLTQAEMHE